MSFFDHFPGSSLDATKWTAITTGSGAVTVTDSYVKFNTPAQADAAAMYYNTQLNKAVSQFWLVCMRYSVFSAFGVKIVTSASAPIIDTNANYQAIDICGIFTRNSNTLELQYVDSGGTRQRWNPATPAFQTTGVDSVGLEVVDDYIMLGIEFDAEGGNSRFRLMVGHQTSATSTYSPDVGILWVAVTDWVNWSSCRSHTNGLWLVIGDPTTTGFPASDIRVEWVRFANGTKQWAMTNGRDASSGDYSIRRLWSFDGKFFLPEDRSSVIFGGGGVSYHGPCMLESGGTCYLAYWKNSSTGIYYATASSWGGTFTEIGTIATPAVNHQLVFPSIISTPFETGREFQMLVDNVDTSSGNLQRELKLYTWTTWGGTVTDRGAVLTGGAGGSDDEYGCVGGVPWHRNGQYEVFYTGQKPCPTSGVMYVTGLRATGATLDALTKDGVSARIAQATTQFDALTANLDGSSVSVGDSTGYDQDELVYFKQNNTGDDWSGSKARKNTSGTTFELYFRMCGFTTANGAKVYSFRAGNQQIREIRTVGSETWINLTIFNFPVLDKATWGGAAFQEESALMILPAGVDPTAMASSYYSLVDTPCLFRSLDDGPKRSNENMALVRTDMARSGSAPRGFPRGMFLGLGRRLDMGRL